MEFKWAGAAIKMRVAACPSTQATTHNPLRQVLGRCLAISHSNIANITSTIHGNAATIAQDGPTVARQYISLISAVQRRREYAVVALLPPSLPSSVEGFN
jgi:hypothetical protein